MSISLIVISLIASYNYISSILLHEVKLDKYTHKTLYISSDFSNKEIKIIKDAAHEWEVKTKYRVVFSIVELPIDEKIQMDGIIIVPLSEDHPAIITLDNFGGVTLGFYNNTDYLYPYISLVTYRLNDKFFKVTLHEIGHVLNLDHVRFTTDSVMYPSANLAANTITDTDLIQFCKLHFCKLEDLK